MKATGLFGELHVYVEGQRYYVKEKDKKIFVSTSADEAIQFAINWADGRVVIEKGNYKVKYIDIEYARKLGLKIEGES